LSGKYYPAFRYQHQLSTHILDVYRGRQRKYWTRDIKEAVILEGFAVANVDY
jgi:hypothetical protein